MGKVNNNNFIEVAEKKDVFIVKAKQNYYTNRVTAGVYTLGTIMFDKKDIGKRFKVEIKWL